MALDRRGLEQGGRGDGEGRGQRQSEALHGAPPFTNGLAGAPILSGNLPNDIPAPAEMQAPQLELGGRAATLDGALAVLDGDGKPNLKLFSQRSTDGVNLPAAFLAWDLLSLEGRSLVGKSLDDRWEKLRYVLLPERT